MAKLRIFIVGKFLMPSRGICLLFVVNRHTYPICISDSSIDRFNINRMPPCAANPLAYFFMLQKIQQLLRAFDYHFVASNHYTEIIAFILPHSRKRFNGLRSIGVVTRPSGAR